MAKKSRRFFVKFNSHLLSDSIFSKSLFLFSHSISNSGHPGRNEYASLSPAICPNRGNPGTRYSLFAVQIIKYYAGVTNLQFDRVPGFRDMSGCKFGTVLLSLLQHHQRQVIISLLLANVLVDVFNHRLLNIFRRFSPVTADNITEPLQSVEFPRHILRFGKSV